MLHAIHGGRSLSAQPVIHPAVTVLVGCSLAWVFCFLVALIWIAAP